MFTFQLRRDHSSNWTVNNPTLGDGEPGYEGDTRKIKIGDGHTRWNDLDYNFDGAGVGGSTSSDQAILDHINSSTPHPVYDEGPSLFLLYENSKV